MSSTDPMKDASLIRSEILQRISLRPSHFLQLANTKSSLSMRLITQRTTYNSYYGRFVRSFMATADSSSPVTTKTESSNLSTQGVQSSSLESKEKSDPQSQWNFSSVSRTSWILRMLRRIRKSLLNSSTNTSQTGDESSTSANDMQWGEGLTRAYLQVSQTSL